MFRVLMVLGVLVTMATPAFAEKVHSADIRSLSERTHRLERRPTLRPVSATLQRGRVFVQCQSTRGIPASATMLTWAFVDGRHLLPANTHGALSQYFAGRGVLVDVFTRSVTSPVCIRALAWRTVRLRVTFAISY